MDMDDMRMDAQITKFMNDMGIDTFDDIGFLYQDYIFECNDLIDELDLIMTSTTPSVAEKMIHNLKGVSANLYVEQVYEISKTLNEYLTNHIEDLVIDQQTLQLWQKVKQTYILTKKELVNYFNSKGVKLDLNR